jgi:hypothetical protein
MMAYTYMLKLEPIDLDISSPLVAISESTYLKDSLFYYNTTITPPLA